VFISTRCKALAILDNSKRKTLDSYFSLSTEKKSKSPHEQRNYANNENGIIQSCDSDTSRVTIDIDEPIEIPSITSSQNINIENQKKVQHAEKK
jgi:predicted nuclease of predicted toxin-antitoxin system